MSKAAYDCFCEYTAIKAHFTSNYDYKKYNGKIKSANPAAFNSSNLKIFFQKLAKHNDVQGFLVANFLHDTTSWIREMAYSDRAENIYLDWLKRQQSLTYLFTQDINKLDEDDFNVNFKVEDKSHPLILKLFLRNQITLETLTILVDLAGCEKYLNKVLKDDFIWKEVYFKISKYKAFLVYDRDKYRKILLDKYKTKE
jgi:hypothetical protein